MPADYLACNQADALQQENYSIQKKHKSNFNYQVLKQYFIAWKLPKCQAEAALVQNMAFGFMVMA